jgi:GNAT superfamily N-acetyltransferase
VQVSALAQAPPDATMPGVELTAQATDAWWSTWAAALVGRRTVHQRSWPGPVAELMQRIATPCTFAVVATGGERSAVGMGVVDGQWLGIFNMATVPEYQRRGAAGAALAALLSWGREQGASRAYLQVGFDNVAALRLYERAGFGEAYRYEYLTAPAARL